MSAGVHAGKSKSKKRPFAVAPFKKSDAQAALAKEPYEIHPEHIP